MAREHVPSGGPPGAPHGQPGASVRFLHRALRLAARADRRRRAQLPGPGDGATGSAAASSNARPRARLASLCRSGDVERATERARSLGAAILLEPREGPAGWRSVFKSPAGAEMAFWQPKREKARSAAKRFHSRRRRARPRSSCTPPTGRGPRSSSATAPAAGSARPTCSPRREAALAEGVMRRPRHPALPRRRQELPAGREHDRHRLDLGARPAPRGRARGLAIIAGGRSAGARVACRCAAETGAAAVLCLAFPLEPPKRKDGTRGPSRLPELDAVTCRCSSSRAIATASGCRRRARTARSPSSPATTA